jgi:DNA-binding NtrC family response regulator
MAIKPNQPVVIMTAHAPVEQAEELLIKGAADFIRKPFRPDALRSICEVPLGAMIIWLVTSSLQRG